MLSKKTQLKYITKTKRTSKSLDKENLKLWAEIVKLNGNYICEYPGCLVMEHLNSHHIYTRAIYSLRYEPKNGIVLCPLHHTLGKQAAHHDPDFKEIIISSGVRTKELYDGLKLRAGYHDQKTDKQLWNLYLIRELARLKSKLK